jgi:hypothetical protein
MGAGMDRLIEERIRRAQEEGAFDNLPGEGAALDLNDDPLVPMELRAICRVLKNSGYLPPEVEHLRELRQLEGVMLDETADTDARAAARRRMEGLLMQLERNGMPRVAQQAWAQYADKIAVRLAERRGDGKQ